MVTLFRWYMRMIDHRPFATNVATGLVAASFGDIACQHFVEGNKQWNILRTAHMAVIRSCIVAPILYVYFPWLARTFPGTSPGQVGSAMISYCIAFFTDGRKVILSCLHFLHVHLLCSAGLAARGSRSGHRRAAQYRPHPLCRRSCFLLLRALYGSIQQSVVRTIDLFSLFSSYPAVACLAVPQCPSRRRPRMSVSFLVDSPVHFCFPSIFSPSP